MADNWGTNTSYSQDPYSTNLSQGDAAVNQNAGFDAGALGGGWVGGGGGGGGGSSGPTQDQKDAAKNLAAIVNYNVNTLTDKAKNGDKVFDISDKQNKNLQQFQLSNAERTAGNDWYTQQQKLQGVLSQQRDVMGNAYYGSGALDLAEDMARADDMSDVQVLNQLRENMDTIDSDYYEALMSTNNSRNELYLDTESDIRQLFADYASQLNNISPDLVNGENEDEGFPEIIDAEGRSLKLPDWFDDKYFEEHVREAIKPQYRGLVRPDQAALSALKQSLSPRKSNYSSSTNKNYFQRLFGGYNRRTQ